MNLLDIVIKGYSTRDRIGKFLNINCEEFSKPIGSRPFGFNPSDPGYQDFTLMLMLKTWWWSRK